MSSTYSVRAGDTFALIARKVYGSEVQADRIARANPGTVEPLTAGTTLAIPPIPSAPRDLPAAAPSSGENEVSISISGERFRFWTDVSITQSIDSMPVIDFGAPFQQEDPAARGAFRPFSYQPVDVNVGGQQAFSGTMVAVDPVAGVDSSTVVVSAYSLPGVLNDCTAPASAYPLEFNGQTLQGIAGTLAGLFGVAAAFPDGAGPVFERVALDPGKKVLPFLSDLAKQRDLVITADAAGSLVFWKATQTGSPVAQLAQGISPVVSVESMFNPQQYYSHITGLEFIIPGFKGSQFTARNPLLEGVVRPLTFAPTDTEEGAVKDAVNAKLGRMFGNMVAYSVGVATWRDPQGELWQPNTTVTLVAPGAMVYQEYEFLIKSVQLISDSKSDSAVLTLVLPGAFGGPLPEALPWDE